MIIAYSVSFCTSDHVEVITKPDNKDILCMLSKRAILRDKLCSKYSGVFCVMPWVKNWQVRNARQTTKCFNEYCFVCLFEGAEFQFRHVKSDMISRRRDDNSSRKGGGDRQPMSW